MDLELNWNKDDKDVISNIDGSLLVEKNCTINMNVNFNLKIAAQKVTIYFQRLILNYNLESTIFVLYIILFNHFVIGYFLNNVVIN